MFRRVWCRSGAKRGPPTNTSKRSSDPADQLSEAHPSQPGRRQLDGERETFESGAEFDDRLRVSLAEFEAGTDQTGACVKSRTASVVWASLQIGTLPRHLERRTW